ncbi:DUF4358 domain-containing protein [Anaeromicrobium sediminis]|uniref:DUF4358 domain-containing protein n=1 Tax=Anaeromicrobium sediminis TaxID=1478221 RepID=A0A267MND2_9FIRM|nr:DUF4358 domain-containing protein [Anaeromicrobium sediminis]PAB61089.1 hypothetical protein CCE28_01280 [Anaeromicrobium sediminis]
MKKISSLIIIVLTLFLFAGCSQQGTQVNVSVKDIVENIKIQMIEDMKVAGAPEDMFKDGKLPGYMETDLGLEGQDVISKLFNKEDLEEGIVLQHMMNVKSDLIIVLKAKDESKVTNLKASLEKVKEQQEHIWSTYLPDQYEKVKNNIIKAEGNYLVYITFDNPENIETVFDSAFK